MHLRQNPVYLIAGGRSSVVRRGPDPLLRKALETAGKVHPSVAYIGAASNDNAMFRTMITRQLRRAGAGDIKLAPLCGAHLDSKKAIRIMEDSDILFVSGGDVEAGMRILEKNAVTDFLRDQYRQGKPFVGVSAGSIMLGKYWMHWPDPDDIASAELFPCLGIASVCCDTHDEEDNWEELQALARLMPDGLVSYGIPSGTALEAYPDGTVRAAGGEVHCFTRKGKKVLQVKSLMP